MRAVGGRARRWVAIAVGFAAVALGLFFSTPVSAQPQAKFSSTARASDDPLAVYFRNDAVGRAQLSLAATTCGTERWTVKTGADDDRHHVHAGAHGVSIRYLRHRNTPVVKPQTERVSPVETTIYRVHARLTDYVREADGDYHLVLSDQAGRTVIAEIPDPKCVAGISPFRASIRTARAHMDANFSVTMGFKFAGQRVVVRGVGFFDYFHGQTGMAPNDLELHPVIGLSFR